MPNADYDFDGAERHIICVCAESPAIMDVKEMYSAWKQWLKTDDNAKFSIAFETTGGDDIDIASGTKIPPYYFLVNGWRVAPMEMDHIADVVGGILLVKGGGDPFLNTESPWTVRINYQQPVQAISIGGLEGTIEAGVTQAEALRLVLAALAGKLSGAPSGPIVIRDVNDTKNRITATVDANGNRTAVTVDVS